MKKILSLLLVAMMVAVAAAAAGETLTPNELETTVNVASSYENNPVVEGENPLTGLPLTEEYTPILMVVDNAEDAYPHWGIVNASVIFQVPNASGGATKLMALYGDNYPEKAGGTRSARMTMLPLANAFNAAFASGGYPKLSGSRVNVDDYMSKFKYVSKKKYINLLGNHFKEREDFVKSPHNLTGKIKEIHDYLLENSVEFEARPFKFTDEPLTRGEDAKKITIKQYVDKEKGRLNNASYAEYEYTEGKGYTRTNATGLNKDRFTEEELCFANLIVMRVEVGYQENYLYYKDNLKGKGPADIFQNGKYIRGAWFREGDESRLVFTDENGNELELQRGKTFIVVTNDLPDVIYE